MQPASRGYCIYTYGKYGVKPKNIFGTKLYANTITPEWCMNDQDNVISFKSGIAANAYAFFWEFVRHVKTG